MGDAGGAGGAQDRDLPSQFTMVREVSVLLYFCSYSFAELLVLCVCPRASPGRARVRSSLASLLAKVDLKVVRWRQDAVEGETPG